MIQPRRATVVMLGASNLTRGISTAVSWAQYLFGSPLDFYVALGHGRSYGMRSKVFVRELPGIRECSLWADIEHREREIPVYGLITDIGNDILYHATVEDIVAWLRFALDRLRAIEARITMVQLPMHNILHITDWQFWLLKNVLFPGRQLDKANIKKSALQLCEIISCLASEYHASLVQHQPEWYGFDPIHFRRRYWRSAWNKILSAWFDINHTERNGQSFGGYTPPPVMQSLYLSACTPALRWIAGIEQRCAQPTGVLSDGSSVHLY